MNIDCQWINKNLEALFTGALSREDQDRAQHHIDNCGPCSKELAALNSIDPLVKRYFEGELNRIRHSPPRTVAKGRLVALTSAALAAVALLLVFTLRTSPPNFPAVPNAERAQSNASAQPAAVPPAKILDGTGPQVERAKPVESTAGDAAQPPRVLATSDSNAPEFLVSDPAGYSRTLDDYRGHVFVFGVLNAREADAASNLERLYKTFGTNTKFRFLAVSTDRPFKRTNTTFPIAYNRGSKLLGAVPGDFVLLDEAGTVQLRGSLVKDFDRLKLALQEKQ
jgi:hypothetical protein